MPFELKINIEKLNDKGKFITLMNMLKKSRIVNGNASVKSDYGNRTLLIKDTRDYNKILIENYNRAIGTTLMGQNVTKYNITEENKAVKKVEQNGQDPWVLLEEEKEKTRNLTEKLNNTESDAKEAWDCAVDYEQKYHDEYAKTQDLLTQIEDVKVQQENNDKIYKLISKIIPKISGHNSKISEKKKAINTLKKEINSLEGCITSVNEDLNKSLKEIDQASKPVEKSKPSAKSKSIDEQYKLILKEAKSYGVTLPSDFKKQITEDKKKVLTLVYFKLAVNPDEYHQPEDIIENFKTELNIKLNKTAVKSALQTLYSNNYVESIPGKGKEKVYTVANNSRLDFF